MKIISIPPNFILNESYKEEVINNLREIYLNFEHKIALDFSNLIKISEGEVMVLSAQIEKAQIEKRTEFFRNGPLPKSKEIKKILGNLPQVIHVKKSSNIEDLSNAEKEKLLIPTLIDKLVRDLKKIGIKEYFYEFNAFLTELIANAVEHGIENKNISYWLNVEYNRKDKVAQYTFVDMGIGIVDSHKKAGLPLRYNLFGDYKVVIDAFNGILTSSTGSPNRGKGLPQLKDMVIKGFISNFVLITNRVTLQYIDDRFVDSKNSNFVGTYYSWTISEENIKKWKT